MSRAAEAWRQVMRRATPGYVAVVREPGSSTPVTCWSLAQAIHTAALLQPTVVPRLFRGARAYRRGQGYRESLGVTGRSYADNGCMALASLQHYLVSGELRSLSRAQWIHRYLRTGAVDGGFRGPEGDDAVDACATGAVGLVGAVLGRDPAVELQALAHLRRSDGMVGDRRRADGSLDTAVHAHNQGLLIALAHRARAKRLLAEAIDAAAAYFTAQRLWDQPVVSNAIYLRGLAGAGAPLRGIPDYADALWQQRRDERGWISGPALDGRRRGAVLDTAAAAQIFAVLDGVDAALIV